MNYKKRKFKKTIALLLTLAMVPQFIMYGSALEAQPLATAATPKANIFLYDNGSSFDSYSIFPSSALTYLRNAGFTADLFLNNRGATIETVIQEREVVVILSEGQECQTKLQGKSTPSYIHSDSRYRQYNPSGAPVGTYDMVLSDYTVNTSIDRTSNLVILAASYSALEPQRVPIGNSQAIYLYSVMSAMRRTVTDCAIGWTGIIESDSEEMALWMEKFFLTTQAHDILTSFNYANGWLELIESMGSATVTGYFPYTLEQIFSLSDFFGKVEHMINE